MANAPAAFVLLLSEPRKGLAQWAGQAFDAIVVGLACDYRLRAISRASGPGSAGGAGVRTGLAQKRQLVF
jgi:hypothetical protein